MPGVPDKASQRGHVGTRTNQGSRIDYITEKPYLHHQLGVPRAPILALLEAISERSSKGRRPFAKPRNPSIARVCI